MFYVKDKLSCILIKIKILLNTHMCKQFLKIQYSF